MIWLISTLAIITGVVLALILEDRAYKRKIAAYYKEIRYEEEVERERIAWAYVNTH